MASRLSLDDKLAAIRRLKGQPSSPELEAELRRSLGDRSNLVAAAAAGVAGDSGSKSLTAELEAAFDRFMVDPEKNDKLCRAKLAIIQALDKLEHDEPDVFQKAARHVQLEPVWGGRADSAAPLRAAALFALARIGGRRDLPLLVDSLADPERDVRIAAAQAVACFGVEAAGLLLRLKVRLGDSDSEVISECFSGLLSLDPQENLAFVTQFLDPDNVAVCEAAVLALGKSRLPGAFDALKSCYEGHLPAALRHQVLLAISMLRLPVAIDYLIELVTSAPEATAIEALSALRIHAHDPRLRERVAGLVQKNGSRALHERFERDFQV
jgi:HEAT repeat protein